MELKRRHINHAHHADEVLIVLYGIETKDGFSLRCRIGVLIVLYGIETIIIYPYCLGMMSLNRTLWN